MLRKLAVLFLLLLATVSPTTAETQSPNSPHTVYLPLVGRNFYIGDPPLLISALYYDTYISGEPDEAFQIYNPLPAAVSLAGWQVTAGTRTVTFPAGITLNGNAKLWCARKAIDFRQTFGASPGCEYGGDTDPAVPDLTGAALTLHQHGRAGDADQPERQLYRRAGLRSRRHQRARLAGPGGLSLQTLHQLRRGRPDPLSQARPAHRAARARHRHARRLGAGPG